MERLVPGARAHHTASRTSARLSPVRLFIVLPCNVIGELLGVPVEARERLQRWSQQLLNLFRIAGLNTLLETQKAVIELQDYMRPIVEARRREPRDDLPSVLVAAQAEGAILSDEEILGNCVALMYSQGADPGPRLAHRRITSGGSRRGGPAARAPLPRCPTGFRR